MQVNISKTLEGIIARTVFRTTKAKIHHHLKDHLMLELIGEEGALAHQLLSERLAAWELYQLRLRIEQAVKQPSTLPDEEPAHFFRRYTNELLARHATVGNLSTGHLLLDLLRDTETLSVPLFARYRITHEVIAEALDALADIPLYTPPTPRIRLLDEETMPLAESNHTASLLDRFGTDLTAEARAGRIDPVIGREAEIERMVQVLACRKKNNPMLIGEAGVGKTALVEALAQRMVEGSVPNALLGKRLFALDIASLVAGTKFRGEFEERLQQLLDELRRHRDTILFIDEIHTIVGAGATQGALDTANMLKPALARGEIQTIGATTLAEYRAHIERDAALERRFRAIRIEPTSREETRRILQRIAPRYEAHHGVRYHAEALDACIELSERYLTDRQLPDKAIDLMDEAGARAQRSTTHATNRHDAQQQALAAAHEARHEALCAAQYDRAAAAHMQELQLRVAVQRDTSTHGNSLQAAPIAVDRALVEQTVTALTGIPLQRVAGREQQRLQGLEQHLASRVVGQQEAVRSLTRAIRRARAGLKEVHRPQGVFLFVGPTGVGKTLLAKELSKWLFDEERGLIRLDMSEYGEKHQVARLIGSPPGYVGYGEGGQLTEAVRRRPYAVVLFDEIEKAHPDLFNTLLQLFDEGHLTDSAGRRVDFRNTVLIMTSNVGSRETAHARRPIGFPSRAAASPTTTPSTATYRNALERTFAPEFLNRIDEVVQFRPLNEEAIEQIAALELEGLCKRIERQGYMLRISPTARRRLAVMGYEAHYGARALKRTLRQQIEEPIAQLIIDGVVASGNTIQIESSGKEGIRLRVV